MIHTRRARIDAPLVMNGFGSIGLGTLPLTQRHIDHAAAGFTVIEPDGTHAGMLAAAGVRHLQIALTRQNMAEVIADIFPDRRGMIVNLSVDVGSLDLMALCQSLGVRYPDTVIEPSPGFYFGSPRPNAERTKTPCARKCGRWRGGIRAGRRRSAAAVPTPAWCPGC